METPQVARLHWQSRIKSAPHSDSYFINSNAALPTGWLGRAAAALSSTRITVFRHLALIRLTVISK